MSEAKHTPTKQWSFKEFMEISDLGRLFDPDGNYSGQMDIAKGEFIVRACNSYEANEKLIVEMLDLVRNVGGQDDWFEKSADLSRLRSALREYRKQAIEILDKAEGRTP